MDTSGIMINKLLQFSLLQTIASVQEIKGQILADNAPMLEFIKRLGFTLKRIPDEPDVMEAILRL